MSFVYNFTLYPMENDYTACYEWRKVVLRSELWSNLPVEMIEYIAKACIVRNPFHRQPSGSVNCCKISDFGAINLLL